MSMEAWGLLAFLISSLYLNVLLRRERDDALREANEERERRATMLLRIKLLVERETDWESL